MTYPQQPGWGPQQPGWGPPPPVPPRKSAAPKIALVIIGMVGMCCVGSFIVGKRAQEQHPGGNTLATASEPSNAPRQYITGTCASIANGFSNNTRLTQLQREEAWRQFEGKWIRWEATVNLIDRSAFGGIQLQFKCSPNSLMLDGHARFSETQLSKLMQFRQGDVIRFEGRLADWGQFTGISIEDAAVLQ